MRSLTLLAAVAVLCRAVLSQPMLFSGMGSGGQYEPVCDPQSYSQTPAVPLPSLPDQFSTIIEGNIAQFNSSFIIAELYDDPGNRGRFEFIIGQTGQKEVAIFDYDDGEAFLIPDARGGTACGVRSLTDSSEFVNRSFGITHVNGSVHIGTVTNLFQLALNESAVYLGVETVRGIPCNRWQTCHVLENNSYILDYYFVATEDWQYVFSGETIPVQIKLSGTRIIDNGTLDVMDHVYSYIAFQSGPDAVPDSAFQVPTGLPCKGRLAGKDLPTAPPFFSMLIETLDNPNSIGTVREFYDTNLFRIDVHYNNTPISIIHDFDLGLEYIINRRRSNCTVLPLTASVPFYDVVTRSNGTFEMRSPTSFLRLGTGYNFSYEGVTTVRGIEADVWISIRDSFPLNLNATLENGTVELFYSRPGWYASSLFSNTSDPVPLAINITGMLVLQSCGDGMMCNDTQKFSAFYNIYDFSSDEPDFDVFDTSFCAVPGEYNILPLIIPGHEFGMELGQLRKSIRTGLTLWADIPALQVADIQILGENGTDIFVSLQILSLPSIADYSDPRSAQNILQDILNNTSDDNLLPFAIELPSGDSVRPYLLRINPDCSVPPTTTTTTTTVTMGPTTTSSTMDPNSSNCPSSSDSSGGGLSTAVPPTTTTIIITTTTTVTMGPTTTSSTMDPNASNCPSSSDSSSGGLSTAAVASIVAVAMFILGIVCTVLAVLGFLCWRSRRGSFKMTSGSYKKQENEMTGFPE